MNNEPFVKLLDTTAKTQVVTKNTKLIKEVFLLSAVHGSYLLLLRLANFTFYVLRKSKDLFYKSVFSSHDNKKLCK